MEKKLFTIVNSADEQAFLTKLANEPTAFVGKIIFVEGATENYIMVNGTKFSSVTK